MSFQKITAAATCAAFTFAALAAVLFATTGCCERPAAEPPSPVVGSPWTLRLSNNVSLEMLPVAAGSFTMGSPSSEPGREGRFFEGSETQHRVNITKPYWLGKYEVTQAQWEAVTGSTPSEFKGASRPVENVSWTDIVGFCATLTEQERAAGRLPAGYRYTLPTEAQWEYACRAGTTTPFSTGNNLTTGQANYDGNYHYNGNAKGEYRKATTNVGSFAANAWGFYDMHGNVWEWCSDWYGSYLSGSETDPLGAASGSFRVRRGGGWFYGALSCRSADRNYGVPGFRLNSLGFRLALSSVDVK
jgi:formylglycine-generating enzyme required for sulfatase activity